MYINILICTDLLRTLFDLFIAGSDSTATMIKWILIYMAKYAHIQKKVQQVIDEVVPSESFPSLKDRER